MMKLMKYELLRRRQLLLGALLTMLFVEGIVVYAIFRGGNWNMLAIILTILLAMGGVLLPILNTVTKLYADFKQKQGYMLFLTPQSGSRIVWSKMLYGTIETVFAIAIIGGCLLLSGFALDHFQQGAATGILNSIQQEFGTGMFSGMFWVYAGLMTLQMLAQLSIAMLAVTVSRAIMPGSGYNWLIALLMYFAFAVGVNLVNGVLLLAFGLFGDIMQLAQSAAVDVLGVIGKYFAIGAVTYVVWFIGCTTLAGRLVSKNVDL